MKDFFISYNKADRIWAEWIAWQLEEAEYSVVIQAWDFRPGSNFVLNMQRGLVKAERVVAVLSPDFLESLYTQPEWAAAFAVDPTGEQKTLLPVRVRECKLTGLLSQITYINLVGLNETAAKETLLAGVARDRAKPLTAPGFPGTTQHTISAKPDFLWLQYLSALERKVSKVSLFGGTECRALDQVFVELSINEDYDRRPNQAEFLGLMDSELRQVRSGFGNAEKYRDHDSDDPTQCHLTKTKRTIKPDDLLRRHTHAVITGAPGCGKTTLLRYLAWQTLKQWRDAADGGSTGSVSDLSLGTANHFPVFLELKQLTSADFQQASLEDLLFRKAIVATIKPRDDAERDSLQQHFRTLLEQGRVAVFLDGLDEVSGASFFRDLQTAVSDFLQSAYGNNTVLISTRPFALRQFGDAKAMEIQPLNPRQIEQFIEHYYRDVPERQRFQRELQRRRELRELARVPALLGFILQLWRKRGSVTDDKLELYAQITLELAQQLDREKEGVAPEREWLVEDKDGSLKLDLLRQLAFNQLFKGLIHPPYEVGGNSNDVDRLVFTSEQLRAEATAFARTLKEREGFSINSRNLAKDIKATALLRQVGGNHYAFAHLTLQEYLAATALAARVDCEHILCRAYFYPRLVELETLPMTLGLIDDGEQVYSALERLPESITFANLRLCTRGLAYAPKVEPQHVASLIQRLIRFAFGITAEEAAYRELVMQSLYGVSPSFLDSASLRLLAQAFTAFLRYGYGVFLEYVPVTLCRVGGGIAFAELVKTLKDADQNLRVRAVWTLRDMGGEQAVAALSEALKDESDFIRLQAREALTKLSGIQESTVATAFHEAVIIDRKVTNALDKIGDELTFSALLSVLGNANECVARNVARPLHKDNQKDFFDKESQDLLVRFAQDLSDQEARTRGEVIAALKRIGGERALIVLLNALNDPSMNNRLAVVSYLEEIGGNRARAALCDVLKDNELIVRTRAIKGLGRVGGEQAIPNLLEALADQNNNIRLAAIDALIKLGAEADKVKKVLLNSLKERDYGMRRKSAYRLGQLNVEEAVVPLFETISSGPRELRRMRMFVICFTVLAKVSHIARRLSEWTNESLDSKKEDARSVHQSAASALGEINDQALARGIREALFHVDSLVKQKAIETVGYYNHDEQVLQELMRLAKPYRVGRLKKAARDALRRIRCKLHYFDAQC